MSDSIGRVAGHLRRVLRFESQWELIYYIVKKCLVEKKKTMGNLWKIHEKFKGCNSLIISLQC